MIYYYMMKMKEEYYYYYIWFWISYTLGFLGGKIQSYLPIGYLNTKEGIAGHETNTW